MKALNQFRCATLSSVLLMAAIGPAFCQTVEDFYRQKSTIRMIESAGPGSTYMTWGQVVARHMKKYIPGNPNIVVEAMPGGGGIVAANYLYASAPQDGSVIGGLSRNMPLQAFLGKQKGIVFDPRKFNWLGSVETNVRVCAIRSDTGVATVNDLLQKEVTMGGTGPGSGQSYLPTVLNRLVGTKFKVINGYSSAEEINLAIERNEVSGICSNYETIIKEQKALFDSSKMRILFNLERQQNSALNGIAWIGDFIKNDEDRQLFAFISLPTEFGRPYATPPGVPPERVAALKRAFEQTMADPEFISDVAKAGFDLTVTKGEELGTAVDQLYGTPPSIVEKAVAIMPAGGAGD